MHVVHQGAQNQNATGLPVKVVPSSAPPDTSGAENWRMAGAAAGAAEPAAAELLTVVLPATEPHAALAAVDDAPAEDDAALDPEPVADDAPHEASSITAAAAAVVRPHRLRIARRTMPEGYPPGSGRPRSGHDFGPAGPIRSLAPP